MKNISFEKKIITLILFLGVFLSILQFIYNRSLWLDEAYLALNIINKNHFELLKPLGFQQVAPILFLQIEKTFSTLISNSEFGLRLFPLISYFLSLFLFYNIIKIIYISDYAIIFALALFAFNPTFIRYSSEVKQYMVDVLVLTSVYYFLLKSYKNEIYKYYYLCLVGLIGVWLSNVAPIILFTADIYLLYDIYHNKIKKIAPQLAISIVWAASFLLYYFIFIHHHPLQGAMIAEWTNYKAFMPANPLNKEFYSFLSNNGSMIINELFQFNRTEGIIFSILILTGIVSLIRQRRMDIIILSVTPLILHLLLSGFKLYPFSMRLILYTAPGIMILCSFGFFPLVNILFADLKIERFRLLAIFIPLVMAFYFYIGGFPLRSFEIKKSIKFIEQNMHKDDKVFVNSFAKIPFSYYKEISFTKFDTNNVIIGKINNISFIGNRYVADTLSYSNELNLLRGRVWFLFTPIGDEDEKIIFMKKYFYAKGKNIIQEFHIKGSDAFLYDISN